MNCSVISLSSRSASRPTNRFHSPVPRVESVRSNRRRTLPLRNAPRLSACISGLYGWTMMISSCPSDCRGRWGKVLRPRSTCLDTVMTAHSATCQNFTSSSASTARPFLIRVNGSNARTWKSSVSLMRSRFVWNCQRWVIRSTCSAAHARTSATCHWIGYRGA